MLHAKDFQPYQEDTDKSLKDFKQGMNKMIWAASSFWLQYKEWIYVPKFH